MKKTLKIITLLSLLFVTVSCGFRPLNHLDKEEQILLSKIKVNRVNTEKPYLLRAYLEDELNPKHITSNQMFEINVTVTKAEEDLLIQKDSTVVRKNIIGTVSFDLYDLKKRKMVKRGNFKERASFTQVDSPYASFAQHEKAYEELMQNIARNIKSRVILALYANKD